MTRLVAGLWLIMACSAACGDDSDMRPPLSSQVGSTMWKLGDVGQVVDTHKYASGVTGAAGADLLTMPTSALTVSLDMRFDTAHDAARHLLFIEAGHGMIVRYDLEQAKTLDALPVAADGGMDLSPDGATLLVALGQLSSGAAGPAIHRIDLNTQTDHVITLPGGTSSLISGSYAVAFIDDERALVSLAAPSTAPVPLLMLWLSDEHAEVVGEIEAGSVLVPSADRSAIGIVSGEWGGMKFGRYLVADARLEQSTATQRVRALAVSRDAQQYALATDDALLFLDGTLQVVGQESRTQQTPVGVAYNPSADNLCVAWKNRGVSSTTSPPALDVYDIVSLQRVAAVDTLSTFESALTSPYSSGRLKFSRDGKLLFANVDGGVAMYRLEP